MFLYDSFSEYTMRISKFKTLINEFQQDKIHNRIKNSVIGHSINVCWAVTK